MVYRQVEKGGVPIFRGCRPSEMGHLQPACSLPPGRLLTNAYQPLVQVDRE